MTDEKHLEILRKGVEAWNQWRLDNPDTRPNLHSADLRDVVLRGVRLRNTNLSYATS